MSSNIKDQPDKNQTLSEDEAKPLLFELLEGASGCMTEGELSAAIEKAFEGAQRGRLKKEVSECIARGDLSADFMPNGKRMLWSREIMAKCAGLSEPSESIESDRSYS